MLRLMVMWHPVRLALLALMLAACGGANADVASSEEGRSLTRCSERLAIDTYSDDTTTRHDTPELAALAYHRYAKQFDFPIAIPADGYTVRAGELGQQALVRSGTVEMTAAMDKGGWRITEVRECQQ